MLQALLAFYLAEEELLRHAEPPSGAVRSGAGLLQESADRRALAESGGAMMNGVLQW